MVEELVIHFRIALYPMSNDIIDSWEEDDDYDFKQSHYEKFNSNIITNDKVSHFIIWFTQNNNWTKNNNVVPYLQKLIYNDNGEFSVIISNLTINLIEYDNLTDENLLSAIWPEDLRPIKINGELFEPDIEIINIHSDDEELNHEKNMLNNNVVNDDIKNDLIEDDLEEEDYD